MNKLSAQQLMTGSINAQRLQSSDVKDQVRIHEGRAHITKCLDAIMSKLPECQHMTASIKAERTEVRGQGQVTINIRNPQLIVLIELHVLCV